MTISGVLREIPMRSGHVPIDEDYAECCLHEYFERVVSRHRDRVAVSDGVTSYDYGQVERSANRLANALVSLGAGGVVVVYLPSCAELMAAFYGTLKAGCTALLIDPSTPHDRVRSMLDDSGATFVVTTAGLRPSLPGALPVICIDLDLDDRPDRRPALDVDVDAPAALIYTSGSTGTPKGIVHSHRDWMIGLGGDLRSRKSTPENRIGLLFSANSSTTLFIMITSMFAGSSFHVYDTQARGVAHLVDWLEQEAITELRIAATSFRLAFSGEPEPHRMRSLDHVTVGGEMMHASDLELFKRWFPRGTYFRLGLASSEDLLISLCYLSHDTVLPPESALPAGYVYESMQVEIHDDDGRAVPPGVIGEIVTRSPVIADGYRNKPELSGAFSPDPDDPAVRVHRTGDLGYMTEDGLLFPTGRKDHMVKVRGNRVELGEIEARLLAVPGVHQACVVDRTDHHGATQLVAYVAVDVEELPSIRGIQAELSRVLPAYMLPARYVFVEELPTNSTGKVDRQQLPEPGTERPDLDEPYVAPSGVVEEMLAAIWSEVLGIDEVGVDDDFMQLGGDSLSAAQVFFLVEEGLGRKLAPSVLLSANTIRLLAEHIAAMRNDPTHPVVELQRGEPGAPTLILFAPMRGDVIGFRDLVRHLPGHVRVLGVQSWTGDRRAMARQSVDQLLDAYLPLLRAEQPHGPYHLAGLSFGGALAYQAAHRLIGDGERVGFVALFDTFGPGRVIASPGQSPLAPSRQVRRLRRARTVRDFGRGLVDEAWLIVDRFVRVVEGSRRRRAGQDPDLQIHSPILREPYTPPRLAVEVHLFRSSDHRKATHSDPDTLGWRTVVDGSLHLHDVAGRHHHAVRGENAEKVGAILTEALAPRSTPAT